MECPIRVLYAGHDHRAAAKEALSNTEAFVVVIEDPEAARSTLRTRPEQFDCVLAEHTVEFDSIAFYRRLQRDREIRTPPFVVRSRGSDAAVKALNAGIDGYVLTNDSLNDRLRDVVGGARREDDSEADWRLRRRHDRLETHRSVVSHDLRTPLNVAQGFVDILRAGDVDDRAELLDEIAGSLDQLKAYLVDLETLESQGTPVEEFEPVEIDTVARAAWERIETGDTSLEIETNSTVRADGDRLTAAFQNVYANAIEHGGAAVIVTVGETDGGFYIEDDGRGPETGRYDDLFEPGVSTTDSATGLGLAIVEQIAAAHRWDVSASEGTDGGVRIAFDRIEGVPEPCRKDHKPGH